MKAPSTTWREVVGADEETRFQGYGDQLVAMQRRTAERAGPGRALHRKQHLGLRATVEVLGDLPAHARHGLFASPGRHDAQIRLSNGTGAPAPDKRPDVRGFAIRVLSVSGAGALGGPATAQCFVLINTATFAFPNVEDFMGVVVAAAQGPLPVLRHLMKRHGFFGGLRQARLLGKGLGKPFAGFAREPFHSAAPIACGPYAAKVRLLPTGHDEGPPARRDDWSADVIARLAKGELRWDLQLQFFVDEATTPIEDPTVAWPEAEAPFVTVARVVAPTQDPRSPEGKTLAEAIEAGVFDPWNALADHRPLGEIMRARKVAYFASQKGRGAA
ncbi:MAG TPA: hypothetical protein VN253_04890 [Kofleriaceae bacterium]|nr:hypothetical protein [Kofleriaceae bacterium]